MQIQKVRLGNKFVMPFTIPSGIITTEVSALERIANDIPEIGILTTKSIGIEPKAGNREPIIAQYEPYSFVNAVGLTNPGAVEFADKLSKIKIPENKFLLISIFGKNAKEFADVANILKQYADGFELNLSCPHAQGYGMQLGQDPNMVAEIISAVKNITNKPIFAKLTPNAVNIATIAEAAMNAGAYGITAINTVGPGAHLFDNNYVLTNKVGGMSGKSIKPIGLKCIKDITEKLGNIPIIAGGGIYNANDARDYAKFGISAVSIGTALAGMNQEELKKYFSTLVSDLENNTNNTERLIKKVNMNYRKFNIASKKSPASDLHILQMNDSFNFSSGQFVFAWLPEKGEKPFSIAGGYPLTIAFQERGCFTKELAKLKEGDDIYFRGPYGQKINIPKEADIILVGGGAGIAGIYPFARKYDEKQIVVAIGAKDQEHLLFYDKIKQIKKCNLLASTEDGSLGHKGYATDLLKTLSNQSNYYFINCGPKAMVEAAIEIEKNLTTPDKIFSSIDYMTSCGIGICGKCTDKNGLRTCIEGPFMNEMR